MSVQMSESSKIFRSKPLVVSIITLLFLLFYSFNVFAASSSTTISSSNPNPSGPTVYCGDLYINQFWAENDSSVNFYASFLQSTFGFDRQVKKTTISDYEQYSTTHIYTTYKGDYYPHGEWTGESPLNYLQGGIGIVSK
ncbi:MAG: hypothetical protein ABF629_03145 [Sporolactobacillus sp.]